jgi:hypothetical protein
MADASDSEASRAGRAHYLSSLGRENAMREVLGFPLKREGQSGPVLLTNDNLLLVNLALRGVAPEVVQQRIAALGRRQALRQLTR